MGSPSNLTVFLLAMSGLILLPFAVMIDLWKRLARWKKGGSLTTKQKLMHSMLFPETQAQHGGLDSQDHI
jgi:hypothetical protein